MTHPVLNPDMSVRVTKEAGRTSVVVCHRDDCIPWSPAIADQFEKFADRVEIHLKFDCPLPLVVNPSCDEVDRRWYAIFVKAAGSDCIQIDVDSKGIVIGTRRKAEYVFLRWVDYKEKE